MTSKVTAGGGPEQPAEEPASPPQVPRQQPAPGRASVTRQDLPVAGPAARQEPPEEHTRLDPPHEHTRLDPPLEHTRQEPAQEHENRSPESGSTSAEPPVPAAPPVPLPSPAPAPAPAPAPYEQNWHRYHFAVGAFLLAYCAAGLLGTLIGWSGRQKEIAGYLDGTVGLGAGAAGPVLIGIKVIEVLLTIIVLAGVLRRKDVWYLPALTGWIIGFAIFCGLDVWAGRTGRLVEHVLYLAAFSVLLIVSYGLSVKVRVGRTAAPGGGPAAAANLSRTQEIALAALNRWQRGAP